MGRNHVHFAIGLPSESGVISGMRKSAEVYIYIDSARAMAEGIVFFKSSNGVILTAGLGPEGMVPPSCFSQVIVASTKNVIFRFGVDVMPEDSAITAVSSLSE